jgi:hypothetical protein
VLCGTAKDERSRNSISALSIRLDSFVSRTWSVVQIPYLEVSDIHGFGSSKSCCSGTHRVRWSGCCQKNRSRPICKSWSIITRILRNKYPLWYLAHRRRSYMLTKQVLACLLASKIHMNTIGTAKHLAVGLSSLWAIPRAGEAFLVGPCKPRPVDHCCQLC